MSLAEKLRAADENQKQDSAARAAEPLTRAEPAGNYPNRYAPIRPNGKRCEFTGLRHAKLYHLLSAGGPVRKKVRVANLRTPGATLGQNLFHVGDMLRYLDELAGGEPAAPKGER
jgi:hypothetical protein